MSRTSFQLSLLLSLFLVIQGTWAQQETASLLVFEREALEAIAEEPATIATLKQQAQQALRNPLYSVTDKKSVADSNDPHDYYSLGPYWWPNPNIEDGLPYIRRDGERNPEINTQAGDNRRLVALSRDVTTLALAFHFTDEQRYASKARQLLRAWFIDQDTRMHPNFQHAQAIPGISTGRGIGIIEARFLIPIMDATTLLGAQLSTEEHRQIRQWYTEFNHWLRTSDNGFEEDNWHNNHGTWFDAQVVAYALFTSDLTTAQRRLRITQMRRIGGQFDRHGNQHAELERTRPWHYANFNLEAYNLLGRLGENAGVDIWNYSVDGHALRQGYVLIAETVLAPETWPYKEKYGFDPLSAASTLYTAQRVYDDTLFTEAWQSLHQNHALPFDPRLTPVR
ncbi:alginate lyase family protein [Microbulbifer agarilyticus]